MTDIVEQLRRQCGHDSRSVDSCIECEAADEIERLREEIASCTEDIGREVSEGNRYMLEAAQLREQLAACQKDAERYRCIRGTEIVTGNLTHIIATNALEDLDAAIDAAMNGKS